MSPSMPAIFFNQASSASDDAADKTVRKGFRMSTNELAILRAEELSAVCFVRDYVELHFDGPIVRAIALPDVTIGEQRFRPGASGWRDALCALIGRKVTNVVLDELHLELSLTGDASVEIELRPRGESGEAMHFVPAGGGPAQIW